MAIISKAALHVAAHPLAFVLQTLRGFRKNQGMLLAGAIAYYALLSIVPVLILSVIVLSRFVDQADLLILLGRSLAWLVPNQADAVLADVSRFLANRVAIGSVLLITLMAFSSAAFSVIEKALSVILVQHETGKKRHFLVSALLPYCFMLFLWVALLCVMSASVILQAVARESIHLFGYDWSLDGVSGTLLYVIALAIETLIVAAIYLVMPIRRVRPSHALIGGFTATALWEIVRHILVWYFTTLSKASIVYGSFATAVIMLLSMEVAAALLLLGAQVIAEYERIGRNP